jgi:hypothetical protein
MKAPIIEIENTKRSARMKRPAIREITPFDIKLSNLYLIIFEKLR